MSTIFKDVVEIVDGALPISRFNDGSLFGAGTQIRIDLLDGWDNTADPVVEISQFGYSDGVATEDRFPLKEQYFQVGGYVVARTRYEAELIKDVLSVIFDHNRLIRLIRNGPIAKAVDVRRSGRVEFSDDIEIGFRWIVTLMSPWPYKVGPVSKTGLAGAFSGGDMYRVYQNTGAFGRVYQNTGNFGRVYVDPSSASTMPTAVTAVNAGTATGYPLITVSGPLPSRGWSLVNETTGESQTFELELAAGQGLTLNSRDKRAFIGSQPVEYYLRGDWITLVPGSNTIRLLTSVDNPTASVQVSYNDTYKR